MKIEAKNFTIKLTHGELWTLAFDVKNNLIKTIESHWVHHQFNWKENEKERIGVIIYMFNSLGRPDLHSDIESKAKEIFERFNAKIK